MVRRVLKTLVNAWKDRVGTRENVLTENRELTLALARVEAGTSLIRETLASVDEIFLLFGPDGNCFASPSARAREILGFDPEGCHVCDVLQVPAAQRADVRRWFAMLFDARHAFETLRDLGPSTIAMGPAPSFYRVRYFPMRDGERVENIIVTLLDVTEGLRAEADRDRAEARANFVLAIANHRLEFASFLRDIQNFGHSAKTLEYDELRRTLHTHKGTAAVFYMKDLVQAIHALEVDFNLASFAERAGVMLKLEIELPRLVQAFVTAERDVLDQLRVFGDRDLVVSERLLAQARLKYAADARTLRTLDDVLKLLRARDVGATLAGFEKHAVDLAGRLGKKVSFALNPDSDFCALLGDTYQAITSALVHAFDNAVDHGLESPADRRAAGKPEIGRLRAGVYRVPGEGPRFLEIRITDDGRGIDPAKVRSALRERGFDVDATADDHAVLQRVFDLGVSTRAAASVVSGMGVGLNGLRTLVAKSGGSVTITSRLSVGTTLSIRLPAPEDGVWFAAIDGAWFAAAA